jgi:hypothetical protein
LAAEWPGIAAYRGYRNALLAAQGEEVLTAKALERLIAALKEPDRLLRIERTCSFGAGGKGLR